MVFFVRFRRISFFIVILLCCGEEVIEVEELEIVFFVYESWRKVFLNYLNC